tara:strand:- start:1166 stop:1414 length:249 start_codon:yes stop_codon:yes gene_type:complete
MTKINELPSEGCKVKPEIFEVISKHLTPEFSKEDWVFLQDRAMEGDFTSMNMYVSLLEGKVLPYLNPNDTISKSDSFYEEEN